MSAYHKGLEIFVLKPVELLGFPNVFPQLAHWKGTSLKVTTIFSKDVFSQLTFLIIYQHTVKV